MSSSLRLISRSLLQPAKTTSRAAAFSTSARRAAGKEDRLHSEGRAEEIEHHKQDQLQKQKEGKGHWKDELASSSESIIKAERGEIKADEDTIKKLQEESVKAGKQ